MRKEYILLLRITWMDVEPIMLSEISQIEKDEHFMISLICRILRNHTYKNRQQKSGYQGGGEGEIRQMLFKDTNLQQVVNKP